VNQCILRSHKKPQHSVLGIRAVEQATTPIKIAKPTLTISLAPHQRLQRARPKGNPRRIFLLLANSSTHETYQVASTLKSILPLRLTSVDHRNDWKMPPWKTQVRKTNSTIRQCCTGYIEKKEDLRRTKSFNHPSLIFVASLWAPKCTCASTYPTIFCVLLS
jgi:hypothetical protein